MSASSVPAVALSEPPSQRDWFVLNHTTPAWLSSLLLHFAIVICGALLFKTGLPMGGGGTTYGHGGEVLLVANSNPNAKPFLSEGEVGGGPGGDETGTTDTEGTDAGPGNALPGGDSAPVVPGVGGLPKAVTSGGAGKATTNAVSATGSTGGRLGPGAGKGGSAATSVFGAIGEGQRFMYVFDRSSSMSGAALAAAKRELNLSLTHLGDVHQFGIVFYNHTQTTYGHTTASNARMYFAKKENRILAERFVSGMSAQGATDHLPALKIALEARPDVIFFLTDADDPVLTAAEIQKVKSYNAGCVINAIQFGYGPKQNFDNFLEQLSADSGGAYRYVDVHQLSKAK